MANERLVSQQAYMVRVTAALVPGLGANQRTVGNITTKAGMPPVIQALVPGNETWHIEDIYNPGGIPVNETAVEILVNNTSQPYSPYLTAIRIADPTRAKLPRTIMLSPASSLNVNFINIVAIVTTTEDIAVHIKIMRYPSGVP